MRRAARALRLLVDLVSASVGLEGAFLLGGTASLAIGASYFSPAGPWIVVGLVGLLLGVALALPRRE